MEDKVFDTHLNNSMNALNIRAVLNSLEKIYTRSKKGDGKKSRGELAAELDLFFGPSKIFG